MAAMRVSVRSAPHSRINILKIMSIPANPAGRFGPYGGRYVPETLVAALDELAAAYDAAKGDPAFQSQFQAILNDYVGRPSRLYFAERLTAHAGGARIYLKR